MKPTKKRKNTYVVKYSILAKSMLFSGCDATPMYVVKINGKDTVDDGGWQEVTRFPNPAATEMVRNYDILKPVMGEKLSSTIVEYLDKKTGEPVAMLFPTNALLYRTELGEENFMQHLNHATRQDLKRQIGIRDKFLKKITEKQNQR